MIKQSITEQEQKQLLVLLQSEIRFTRKLYQALEQEADALIASNLEGLQQATADKSDQIRQLELIAQQRDVLVETIGGEALFENEPYASLWQDLLTLAASCQEKNLINGGIIKTGIRQSQQALDILQGVPNKPELYNQSGHTTRSAKTSNLAQA